MTDRIPLDDLTSDALDTLYDRLDRAEADLASERARGERRRVRLTDALGVHADTQWPKIVDDARCAHELAEKRAMRLAATVARVRQVAARIRQGAPWTANDDDIADHIETALKEPTP